MDVPACTLPITELPTRLAEFDHLFATALRSQTRLSPTAVRWRLDPAAEATVRDLTARESACCRFFSFSYAFSYDRSTLDIEVPPAHADVLDALAARAEAHLAHR